MAQHTPFDINSLLKGGLQAGAGALLGDQLGLSPLQGAGLGILGGQALGGNSAAQRLALGLGPIALAQNAADKRLDKIPGGFSTPFSNVRKGVTTIDPTVRQGQQDLLTGLQGNENRFIQARVRPFERQAARTRANIEQGLARRGLSGSSLGTNELTRFEGQINPLIADQTALATNESFQAQNQILNQRFNQELAALGLGVTDINLLTQQAQLKTDLLGRTIDATGRILAPPTTSTTNINAVGGGAGAAAPQSPFGGIIDGALDAGAGFIGDALGGIFGSGAAGGAAGLGIGGAAGLGGSIPDVGPSASLDIGGSLGFDAIGAAGLPGNIGNFLPGAGTSAGLSIGSGLGTVGTGTLAGTIPNFGAGALAAPGGFFGQGSALASGAEAFGAPAGFDGLFGGSQGLASGGASGGAAAPGGIFSGAGGAALVGGGLAGLSALLTGQGLGQAVAQGGGAAAGAAAGFAVGGPAGAVLGGVLGALGGGKLGEALGISQRGKGESKADYSLTNQNAGGKGQQLKSSSDLATDFGFNFNKHLSSSGSFQKALDAVAEVDNSIAAGLTPEETAAVQQGLKDNSGVGRNRNEGKFSPQRMAVKFFDNRDQVMKSTLTPERYAELNIGEIYAALKTGDAEKINQVLGVA